MSIILQKPWTPGLSKPTPLGTSAKKPCIKNTITVLCSLTPAKFTKITILYEIHILCYHKEDTKKNQEFHRHQG